MENLTKVDFHKKPTPNKSDTNAQKQPVARNLKPENDDMGVTPKSGRSNNTTLTQATIEDEKMNTQTALNRTKSIGGQSNQPGSTTNTSSKKVPPVDQLLTHTSDTAVKPITGNKEIEKPIDSVFNKELLPFSGMNADDVVKGIDGSQVENHLADIYNYLGNIFIKILLRKIRINHTECT